MGVYAALVASAMAAFFLEDVLWSMARGGRAAQWIPVLPAALFSVFVVIFTIDRAVLVRRRAYPTGRAFFQVAFALVFLSLLWPSRANELRDLDEETTPASTMEDLLRHREDAVRALACEVVGLRGDARYLDAVRVMAEHDPSPEVRQACADAAQHRL